MKESDKKRISVVRILLATGYLLASCLFIFSLVCTTLHLDEGVRRIVLHSGIVLLLVCVIADTAHTVIIKRLTGRKKGKLDEDR